MKNYKSIIPLINTLLISSFLVAQTFPSKDWQQVDHPTFVGWNEAGLMELQQYVIDSTMITGIMIIHDGKVIFNYGNIKENSYIASCRKSVLAMLYGKYVMDGTIDLDKTMADLQLVKPEQLLDIESNATIRDIISSRSGIFLPASNRGDFLHLAPERGSVAPGSFWLYSNYDFNLAGRLFEMETKRNIYDEITAQFAIPLGMQDWDRSLQEKSGDYTVSDNLAYHMWFSTRDMARLGLLMLNKGKWNNEQIIDEEWVAEMTTPKTSAEEVDKIAPFMKKRGGHYGYGYMWWLWDKKDNPNLKGAYSALGAWGQNITVIPMMNTVLAIKTNADYGRRKGNHNPIIDRITKLYNPESPDELIKLGYHLEAGNIDEFIDNFTFLKSADKDIDVEGLLNNIGYELLHNNEYEKAIKIFHLNVKSHPNSWNLYDSLGEGYFYKGDFALALANYKKAVELNINNQFDNNDRIAQIIKRIKLKMKG